MSTVTPTHLLTGLNTDSTDTRTPARLKFKHGRYDELAEAIANDETLTERAKNTLLRAVAENVRPAKGDDGLSIMSKPDASERTAWCISSTPTDSGGFTGFLAICTEYDSQRVKVYSYKNGRKIDVSALNLTGTPITTAVTRTIDERVTEAYADMWAFLQDRKGLSDDVRPLTVASRPREPETDSASAKCRRTIMRRADPLAGVAISDELVEELFRWGYQIVHT